MSLSESELLLERKAFEKHFIDTFKLKNTKSGRKWLIEFGSYQIRWSGWLARAELEKTRNKTLASLLQTDCRPQICKNCKYLHTGVCTIE